MNASYPNIVVCRTRRRRAEGSFDLRHSYHTFFDVRNGPKNRLRSVNFNLNLERSHSSLEGVTSCYLIGRLGAGRAAGDERILHLRAGDLIPIVKQGPERNYSIQVRQSIENCYIKLEDCEY